MSSASTGLCGGCRVTGIPTATPCGVFDVHRIFAGKCHQQEAAHEALVDPPGFEHQYHLG